MRGLHRSTGYWQTQAAKEDWAAMAEFASENGFKEQADKFAPSTNWGWRRIDKCIGRLREFLQDNALEFTLPSAA